MKLQLAATVLAYVVVIASRFSLAGDIVVRVPEGTHVDAAEASPAKSDTAIDGVVTGQSVRIKGIQPDVPYDVALTLADRSVLQGVDMRWYSLEPAKPGAGEMDDDDHQQITSILKDVPSFYNRDDLLLLQGDHDRAVALVQLVRDQSFHSDKGGEVICHVELWYFKNRHGGWEKVQQSNRVLRRERFASAKAFHDAVDHLRWVPALGGLKLGKDQQELVVTLPADAMTAATSRPSDGSSREGAATPAAPPR